MPLTSARNAPGPAPWFSVPNSSVLLPPLKPLLNVNGELKLAKPAKVKFCATPFRKTFVTALSMAVLKFTRTVAGRKPSIEKAVW